MDAALHSKLQQLGDLELAILVALVSSEHCMLSCSSDCIRDLQESLRSICSRQFGLQVATIDCSPKTNVDEFSEAILVDAQDDYDSTFGLGSDSRKQSSVLDFPPGRRASSDRLGSIGNTLDDRRIADVIIATNLDVANSNVQVQTLELLRTKRIFTRTAMHLAPKNFLFVAITSKPGARLTHHLNDMFAMSHFHDDEDELPNGGSNGKLSTVSFYPEEIKGLRSSTGDVHITAEMSSYISNVTIFMRMSRYIKSGVTAAATMNLRDVTVALAVLHGLNYIPPSLVTLAVKKVYPHRLVLATAENEKSLQWGSDPEAVRQMLEGLNIDRAIDEVLASVETPL